MKANEKIRLEYLLLGIILLYALCYEIVFNIGPSYFGDDTVYTNFAQMAAHGLFVENGDTFSLRILNIYPIAFFYLLFGINDLTTAGWATFSFLGSILIAYYIGKELYNGYAGLIAALLLAFFPLFATLSATPTPNVPEAFLTGLTFLALLWGERRKSRLWYFVSGVALVASVLTTPASGIIVFVVAVYLVVELLRQKIKINKVSLYLVYGFAIALVILLLYNYIETKNPLATVTTVAAVYSTAGTPAEGILINQNLDFYFNVMFPYHVYSAFQNAIVSLNLNPLNIWQNIYGYNYNYVGFYFYLVVLCGIYLLAIREKRAYVPFLWFTVAWLYLEFGFIYISFFPFQYILTARLERYMTIIGIPSVLLIAMALVNFSERSLKKRYPVTLAIPGVILVFLLVTAYLESQILYTTIIYQTFDQHAIANYLNTLPNTTKVYYESGFSLIDIYMGYENQSRLIVYDQLKNCSLIPEGSYVVIPKYVQVFNISYTPNPTAYCPNWELVLSPNVTGSWPSYLKGSDQYFAAKLYFVPGSGSNVSTQTVSNTSNQSATNPIANSPYDFFNLTGVGIMNETTHKLETFVLVNNVTNTSITLNRTEVNVGELFMLNVTFRGSIYFNGSPSTLYYIFSQPYLINNHYFGVEFANESDNLTVQSNGPWNYFFSQVPVGSSYTYTPSSNSFRVSWHLVATPNVTNEDLKFCAGFFASYANSTVLGGWSQAYDTFARAQEKVFNNSVINIPGQCAYLKVD